MSDFDYKPGVTCLFRLITLPTVETVSRLKNIMSQPPIKFDPFQTHHVTVARAYSEEGFSTLRNWHHDLYSSWHDVPFQFESFDYRFDEERGGSKIEGNVACNAIEMLRQKLQMTGYPAVYQFLHQSPPLSRAIKAFVISVADTLVMKEGTFTFDGLYLISEEDYLKQFREQYVTASWESPWGQVR